MPLPYKCLDGIALIQLSNPPINSLSLELRKTLVGALEAAATDVEVVAIVLRGAGKVFSGGADITEFDSRDAFAEPSIHAVIDAIERSVKPVVAGIHGAAMGGGLEIAMAAHHRIGLAGSRIALPEVNVGLVPGAGGTQRLPRAVGVDTALRMIRTGESLKVGDPLLAGLFDRVVGTDLDAACIKFAREIVAQGGNLPLLRHRSIASQASSAFRADVAVQAGKQGRILPAEKKCVECVRAAMEKSFEDGLAVERAAFMALVHTRESKALRHAFFAERAAAKIVDIPSDTAIRPIRSAAVVGAGTMGTGIAMNFMNAGIPVHLLEAKPEFLERGIATIMATYASSLKRGKLSQATFNARMALLHPALSYDSLREVDVIVEAVFEDMAAKADVFRKVDAVAKPGAILATNTSTLDINKIAAVTKRPGDVIGMHFFVPANVMPLLEIVRGNDTSAEVLASVMALSKTLKKTGVVSGVCDGFIGNRMIDPYLRQAYFLLEEGALPEQVDQALENWGMAMGPFRAADLTGLDVLWSVRKRRYVDAPEAVYSGLPDRICELGRFGQKTGAGYYQYEKGARQGTPDPALHQLIEAYSNEKGLIRRNIPDEEIVSRCIFALVNEGAAILEEEIAQRASDLDAVYLLGYGFPADRGGPMFYADTIGLQNVVDAMDQFARQPNADSSFWKPHPLLLASARAGKTFNPFNPFNH